MKLTDQHDAKVLAYYGREAAGTIETGALAGLKIAGFQASRTRLVRDGRLIRTTGGRYVPVASA